MFFPSFSHRYPWVILLLSNQIVNIDDHGTVTNCRGVAVCWSGRFGSVSPHDRDHEHAVILMCLLCRRPRRHRCGRGWIGSSLNGLCWADCSGLSLHQSINRRRSSRDKLKAGERQPKDRKQHEGADRAGVRVVHLAAARAATSLPLVSLPLALVLPPPWRCSSASASADRRASSPSA